MPVETRDVLSIWTITENPRDCPGMFVARRHVIEAGGHHPTNEAYTSNDIEPLRAMFRDAGLALIPRDAGDDPVIVESWI